MAGKSTKPSRSSGAKNAKGNGALDRPFDSATLKDAEAVVNQYRLTIEPEPEVGYLGSSVELPFVMADGKTIASCAKANLLRLIRHER